MGMPPIAAKPLFRDPVFDGAADPTPIWNDLEKKWFIYYTNRRATAPIAENPGWTWMHGTHIGIAESIDHGATWSYRGIADIQFGNPDTTFWAPEVIKADGIHHMFVSIVPGIFPDWNHPRDIIHCTSADLLHWKYVSTLKLASDRVIDACVLQLPDGNWRMWYNNEVGGKDIHFADSPDLYTWTDQRKLPEMGQCEGPIAFRWKGFYWLITDEWRGLAVYRSNDALHWNRQAENLLQSPGTGPDDTAMANHASVVVSGNQAYLFYHTHPGRIHSPPETDVEFRRSSLQVVELQSENGALVCDRNQPTRIALRPPGGRGD